MQGKITVVRQFFTQTFTHAFLILHETKKTDAA